MDFLIRFFPRKKKKGNVDQLLMYALSLGRNFFLKDMSVQE